MAFPQKQFHPMQLTLPSTLASDHIAWEGLEPWTHATDVATDSERATNIYRSIVGTYLASDAMRSIFDKRMLVDIDVDSTTGPNERSELAKFFASTLRGSLTQLPPRIRSEVRTASREAVRKFGVLDSPVQIAKYVSALFAAESWNVSPDIYELGSDGLVLDFSLPRGRIACILRDNYVHIVSHIEGDFRDEVYEGEQFEPVSIGRILRDVVSKAAGDES